MLAFAEFKVKAAGGVGLTSRVVILVPAFEPATTGPCAATIVGPPASPLDEARRAHILSGNIISQPSSSCQRCCPRRCPELLAKKTFFKVRGEASQESMFRQGERNRFSERVEMRDGEAERMGLGVYSGRGALQSERRWRETQTGRDMRVRMT